MNALQTLTAKQDTETLLDSLSILEAIIEAKPTDGKAERLARITIIEILEARHPYVDAVIEEWADSLDDPRTYGQVLAAAIRAGETGTIVQAPNGAWWCTDCITRGNTRSELEQHPCHPEHHDDPMED